jgi:hypothetical protein
MKKPLSARERKRRELTSLLTKIRRLPEKTESDVQFIRDLEEALRELKFPRKIKK